MQLDKLRLDLRPRSNAQGLDLGFALLHAGGADVWRAWLALWLPLSALAVLISWYYPDLALGWLLPWWLRPLLERAPLHVLARQVFGEQTSWRDALRAWPRELGGGWFRMLTWWRPFMAGRGLHQPVWVLERARGKVATARRATIARNGTGGAALMFGSTCATFEFVLMMGVLALIGLFMPGESPNPFALFGLTDQGSLQAVLGTAAWCLACAIIGPVYTACTFTLYLNRRATLEAWDIEIVLRQLRPPARPAAARHVAGVLMAAPLLAMALLGMPPPVQAAAPAASAPPVVPVVPACEPPDGLRKQDSGRGPDLSPQQAAVRRQLDEVFAHEDLRGYRCGEQWELRVPPEKEQVKPKAPPLVPRWLAAILAGVFKFALIAGAIALVSWLLWRYAAPLRFSLAAAPEPRLATEVGGLDIREESLPADVAGAVRALWQQGQQRAALALLYRATLSRLVSRQSLKLHHGATEGECLAQARSANAAGTLDSASLALADQATTLWLNAAYGARWPAAETVAALCSRWQAHFDREAA
ncbi:hypothetical protein ACN9MU_05840 [Pseudoduganella sp. R-32]|uniref:hypothetical protein n=1 Tax=Pseudoduganella sp. R-32 TaxID=3404061 RepID=UPI003CF22DB1